MPLCRTLRRTAGSMLCASPNLSIERTHNGGAHLRAPSGAVPPLCAAHVKRYRAGISSTLQAVEWNRAIP